MDSRRAFNIFALALNISMAGVFAIVGVTVAAQTPFQVALAVIRCSLWVTFAVGRFLYVNNT